MYWRRLLRRKKHSFFTSSRGDRQISCRCPHLMGIRFRGILLVSRSRTWRNILANKSFWRLKLLFINNILTHTPLWWPKLRGGSRMCESHPSFSVGLPTANGAREKYITRNEIPRGRQKKKMKPWSLPGIFNRVEKVDKWERQTERWMAE